MAGRGPAPKAFEQRRNHHKPTLGEWIELPAKARSKLPNLPAGDWHDRTVTAWAAWKKDPASSMFGPADVQAALDVAYLYDEWAVRGGSKMAAEIRLRLDGLGLSLKGKQERRWRVVADVQADDADDAEVVQLRPVS